MTRLMAIGGMIGVIALAGCAAGIPSAPGSAPTGSAVQVSVDGTAYPLRLIAEERYMLSHVAPLTLDGRTGPAIRIGGTAGQGRLASHVLNAYCTSVTDYRTADHATTVLYGDFGDFLWQDSVTGEFVFPIPDCRT